MERFLSGVIFVSFILAFSCGVAQLMRKDPSAGIIFALLLIAGILLMGIDIIFENIGGK